jgi:arsenate reductase
MKYRSMGLNERTLSDEEMIDYMTEEYTFIRRPVLIAENDALAGFSKKKYEELVK